MGMSLRANKTHSKRSDNGSSEFHSRVKKKFGANNRCYPARIHLRYHPYAYVLSNIEQVITLYQQYKLQHLFYQATCRWTVDTLGFRFTKESDDYKEIKNSEARVKSFS